MKSDTQQTIILSRHLRKVTCTVNNVAKKKKLQCSHKTAAKIADILFFLTENDEVHVHKISKWVKNGDHWILFFKYSYNWLKKSFQMGSWCYFHLKSNLMAYLYKASVKHQVAVISCCIENWNENIVGGQTDKPMNWHHLKYLLQRYNYIVLFTVMKILWN